MPGRDRGITRELPTDMIGWSTECIFHSDDRLKTFHQNTSLGLIATGVHQCKNDHV